MKNYFRTKWKVFRNKMSRHLPTVFPPEPKIPVSVAEILGDFEEKVKHLTNVHGAKRLQIQSNEATIASLKEANAKHDAEAIRANNVALKLKELVA